MSVQKLDLALGADGLTVFAHGERDALGFFPGRIDPFADNTAVLGELFDRLEERLGSAEHTAKGSYRTILRLAILPPLCEVRLLDLPGLREEEIERVLRRDSSRHFLAGGRSLTVGGIRLGSSGKALAAPVLAAAVPANLLDAANTAAQVHGWEIDRIIPAHAAWWDALESAGSGGKRSHGSLTQLLVASLGDAVHAIRVEENGSAQLRRFPASDLEAIREVSGAPTGGVLILGTRDERAGISELLRVDGWSELRPGDGVADAREVAARGAADALPEIVPAFIARKRLTRERGFTSRAFAAAAVLLIIAAGIYYWGAARAYASVRSERAQLRAVVAPALAARDSLDLLTSRLEDLAALEGQTSGWTAFMVELAVLLPPETHLVSLRAVGDTVVIEGAGGRAGEALEALRTTPLLRDVQLEGPIQRDLEGGTTARERFTVSGIRANNPTAASPSSRDSEPLVPSDGR